jgi:predicted TPR repeat methyltransferase
MARYAEAVSDFDKSISLKSDFIGAITNKARALSLATRFDEALAAYDKALTMKPGLADAWVGRAEALQGLRRAEEAILAYRRALAEGGDAAFIQYALASLGAEPSPVIAPKEFVAKLFDQYADRFDQHLVGKLKYRTPDSLFDVVSRLMPSGNLDILDLGCGTGLAGSRLHPLARTLTGVDISPSMLEVARQRKIYDNLVCSELIEYLRSQSGNFDLAVAADVFVYIGDLSAVFQGVRAALRDRGIFGFSVEAGDEQDFALRATRRYAHSRTYLQRLADDHGFLVKSIEPHFIRQESGIDVAGDLAILQCG